MPHATDRLFVHESSKDADQEELVTRFEREALPYLDALHPAAMRLACDPADAEDLLQETFLRAFAGYQTLTSRTNVKAWLYRLLFTTFIDSLRRLQREPLKAAARAVDETSDPLAGSSPSAEFEALSRLPDVCVKRALQRLPVQSRIPVYLAYVEGYSYQEIAEITGVPIGTVRSRLHRGRLLLSGLLIGYARSRRLVCSQPLERRAGSKEESPG